MLSKTSEVFASSLSLSTDENTAYGIYRNYFITFYENKRNKVVDISCFLGDDEDDSINGLELSDCIKSNIEKYRIDDYELAEDRVHLVSSADISLFRDMLDAVIGILEENGIHGSDYCSACGKPFPPKSKKKVVSVNGVKSLVCDSCAFELIEPAEKEEVKNKSASASASKIVLGSLLGSLVGAVVYALLFLIPVSDDSGILKYFVCLFGLLVGALSVYGARLISKCGFSKPFAWITSVISLLFTAAAHYIGCVIYAVKTYASFEIFKFTPSAFCKLVFSNSSLLRYYAAGTVIGLCAAGVALIFLISSIMKKEVGATKPTVTVTTLK